MADPRKRHESTDSSASTDSDYIPTPPDGGWGWVIVASSLVCNIVVDGIGYSFGIFLLEFVDFFKEKKSTVALVGSLLCGTYLTAGPIVSALTNRFGCRAVATCGSIIAATSFLLSMGAPSVNILMVTYGVMGGFGLGMVYLPSIVSVGYYFEKKRALATGIAVCGSGIGTFIFAPLSKFLLDEYDWKSALMIIAGIILQCAVCGMLMRPLEVIQKPKKKRPRAKNMMDRIKEQAKSKRFRSESECSAYAYSVRDNNSILERVMEAKLLREKQLEDDSEVGSLPSMIFIKARQGSRDARIHKLSLSDRGDVASHQGDVASHAGDTTSHPGSPGSVPKIVVQDNEVAPVPNDEARLSLTTESAIGDGTATEPSEYATPPTSPPNSPPEVSSPSSPEEGIPKTRPIETDLENKKTSVIIKNCTNGSLPNAIHKTHEGIPLLNVPEGKMVKPNQNGTHGYIGKSAKSLIASHRSLHASKEDFARPLYRKDIFYSGSVLNIPQFRSQPDVRSYITSITTIPGEIAPEKESPVWQLCTCVPKSAKDTLQEMMDLSLLKGVNFDLLCFGNVLAFLGFYVPFVYIVDRAILEGIPKSEAAFLVSVIGITNTVGRILAGWLADLPKVDALLVNNVSMVIAGVATVVMPFCGASYAALVVMSSVFGAGVGAFISLSSILICDQLGLEKLTNGFGLLTMFRGFAAVAGPPLAGFVFDSTGKYDPSFYMGGTLLLGGAACHMLLHLPCFAPKPQEMYEDIFIDAPEQLGPSSPRPETLTVEDAMNSV
ncbi:monocarboxylate transporter 14-like [Haliotis asinina]|uniref:monocarboxylate transporter 14-like n=1 Tax=Haliotis asinina TaxID=109174 RepID=UPI0035321D11